MKAWKQEVSILRITVALLGIGAAAAVIAGTFMAGVFTGIRHQQERDWNRELRSAQWGTVLKQFAGLDAVDRFGVLEKAEGNAVDLYWPGGVDDRRSPCGRVRGGTFDSPEWQRSAEWRHAASCARIEMLVRGAHMTRMDLTEWLSTQDPATAPGSYTWFGVYQGPYADMQATIARAHKRIEEGNLAGAEVDARAAVSAGLHFLRGSPEISGMTLTSVALLNALDHLREIAERKGDAARASEIVAASARVADLRRAVWRLGDSAMKAAATEGHMHFVGRLALDPEVPLGLRLHSAVMIGYGGLFHPSEVAFGPSPVRARLLDEMAADPVLTIAVARAREPYRKDLRERVDLYASTLDME